MKKLSDFRAQFQQSRDAQLEHQAKIRDMASAGTLPAKDWNAERPSQGPKNWGYERPVIPPKDWSKLMR